MSEKALTPPHQVLCRRAAYLPKPSGSSSVSSCASHPRRFHRRRAGLLACGSWPDLPPSRVRIPVACGRGSPLTVAGAADDCAPGMGSRSRHSHFIPRRVALQEPYRFGMCCGIKAVKTDCDLLRDMGGASRNWGLAKAVGLVHVRHHRINAKVGHHVVPDWRD